MLFALVLCFRHPLHVKMLLLGLIGWCRNDRKEYITSSKSGNFSDNSTGKNSRHLKKFLLQLPSQHPFLYLQWTPVQLRRIKTAYIWKYLCLQKAATLLLPQSSSNWKDPTGCHRKQSSASSLVLKCQVWSWWQWKVIYMAHRLLDKPMTCAAQSSLCVTFQHSHPYFTESSRFTSTCILLNNISQVNKDIWSQVANPEATIHQFFFLFEVCLFIQLFELHNILSWETPTHTEQCICGDDSSPCPKLKSKKLKTWGGGGSKKRGNFSKMQTTISS